MKTMIEEVEAEIRRVFPAHRPGCLNLISEGDREENVRVRAALDAVMDWTTLEPNVVAEIDRHSGFGFLTGEASRFYLPAFLIADMHEPLNSDPEFHLCIAYPLTSTDELIASQLSQLRERWDPLGAEQARAVARYLEWRIAAQPRGKEHETAYSLSAYWYQRA